MKVIGENLILDFLSNQKLCFYFRQKAMNTVDKDLSERNDPRLLLFDSSVLVTIGLNFYFKIKLTLSNTRFVPLFLFSFHRYYP